MNTQTQTIESLKKYGITELFTIEQISESQMRAENREYNPTEWDRIIDRYVSYGSTFFKVAPQKGCDYTRYYAIYKNGDNRFFKSVSYSSSLTNNGFCKIFISEGKAYRELFKFGETYGTAENTPNNRKLLAKMNDVLSNEF